MVVTLACASSPQASERPRPQGKPLEFSFYAADGTRFDSAGTRGRVTVILLITTYDLNSQLVARRLNELQRIHKPRFNAAAVVLEAMKYGVLVEPFKESLGLSYPVVLADQATLQGESALGGIEVPTLIVLDPQGRPSSRITGAATEREIRAALATALPAQKPN